MNIHIEQLLNRTGDRLWLTDAGLETTMIFHEGFELPHFASFTLLDSEAGRDRLAAYFDGFIDEAARIGAGFVLDTATWRASDGWGEVMGLSPDDIAAANRDAVAFARAIRARRADTGTPIVVNGVCGPHGDGYAPDRELAADEAEAYYLPQVRALAEAGVDMISGVTLSGIGQATGLVRAARSVGLPVVISFTVETDARLISGVSLADAIHGTDAATGGYPAFYMVNCAHPDHFRGALSGSWTARIGGVRANASRMSHAELDNATELDDGDIDELAVAYRDLMEVLPNLRLLGGCCGTDLRHVSAIGQACTHHSHIA